VAESELAQGPTLAAPQAAPADRLAPGAAVGDYVIDGFLGAGAMGEVYAGRHPVIGKRVAPPPPPPPQAQPPPPPPPQTKPQQKPRPAPAPRGDAQVAPRADQGAQQKLGPQAK
jgi:hypothetical protein